MVFWDIVSPPYVKPTLLRWATLLARIPHPADCQPPLVYSSD